LGFSETLSWSLRKLTSIGCHTLVVPRQIFCLGLPWLPMLSLRLAQGPIGQLMAKFSGGLNLYFKLNSHIFKLNQTFTIKILNSQVMLIDIDLPAASSTRPHIDICLSCSHCPSMAGNMSELRDWHFVSTKYRNVVLLHK